MSQSLGRDDPLNYRCQLVAHRRGFAAMHVPVKRDDLQKIASEIRRRPSSVNNSTGDQNISNPRKLSTELPAERLRDPTSLTRQERRAALRVMRSSCRDEKKAQNLPAAPPVFPPISDELAAAVITLCATQGMAYTPDLSMALIRGARIRLDDNRAVVLRNGNELEIRQVRRWCCCCSELNAANPSTGASCYRCASDEVLNEWL